MADDFNTQAVKEGKMDAWSSSPILSEWRK